MTSVTCPIGVVVVAFNASDVIVGCIESLLAQSAGRPKIVVVDNASTDDTVPVIRKWAAKNPDVALREFASGERPALDEAGDVALLHSTANTGFAGGVNLGLALLAGMPEIGHFWVLNPDAFADAGATGAIMAAAAVTPGYGLMGGRVCYADPKTRIQIDGGTINRWTGVSSNVNLGRDADKTALPGADQLDFITGASMVASRRFYESVGPMREDYFLYYEEADWAMRRAALCRWSWRRVWWSITTPCISSPAGPDGSPFSFWFRSIAGEPCSSAASIHHAGDAGLFRRQGGADPAEGAQPQAVALVRGALCCRPEGGARPAVARSAEDRLWPVIE
ncbi:MAG: glycosyltransferase family 2 protein [Defluviimonas denitrificans]